jgi:succinyl-CoA synthetase alpha subunit
MNKVSKIIIKENYYRDSLQLLKVSEDAKKLEGIVEAAVMMGTDTNKEILGKLGFSDPAIDKATDNDMIIAIKAEDEKALSRASEEIEKLLEGVAVPAASEKASDLDTAFGMMPDANLALISIPGEYVKDVAYKILDRGLHIHLFSDHVPIEDEINIKKYAAERELLVLGPGAGTSIINGVAIAFANVVDKGPVGVVAAAGTGLQEVTSLLDLVGIGTKHGLGVGGNDPKDTVGGIMTLQSIKVLEGQPDLEVISLVSKPPSPGVQDKIMNHIFQNTRKKYAIAFIGGHDIAIPPEHKARIKQGRTLHSVTLQISKLLGQDEYERAIKELHFPLEELKKVIDSEASKLEEGQRYLRGLYTGGTLTYETQVILKDYMVDLRSNAPIKGTTQLTDPFKSEKHAIVDLGEEEFTKGRAHPMIDPTIRKLRVIEEAKDGETAVLLMDFVLGYGSHEDPVGALLNEIKEARELAERDGRYLSVVAHVLGTRKDPQGYEKSVERLKAAGVIHMPTNALAAIVAGGIAMKGNLPLDEMYNRFLEVLD